MVLVNILIASICPLIALIIAFCMLFFNNKNNFWWILLISLIIALPALFFVPAINMDASSYLNAMEYFKKFSDIRSLFEYVLSTSNILGEYKSYPISLTILYLIAKTNIYTILFFITVALSYLASLCSVSLFYKNKKIYGYFFMQIISLFCVHYLFSMSVVRFYLAISILILITFVVVKRKNYYYIILYLIPILIHPGIIPPIVIILFGMLIKKFSQKIMLLLIVAIPLIISAATILKTIVPNNYFGIQLNKLFRYVNNSSLVTQFITSKTIVIEITVIIYLLIFIITVNRRFNYLSNHQQRPDIIKIAYYFAAFTIGIAPFNIIFIRYMSVALPLTLAAYSNILNDTYYKDKVLVYGNVLLICIIGLISNYDIFSVSFLIDPFTVLTTPIFEAFKLIVRY